jgi:hypothetical protein
MSVIPEAYLWPKCKTLESASPEFNGRERGRQKERERRQRERERERERN